MSRELLDADPLDSGFAFIASDGAKSVEEDDFTPPRRYTIWKSLIDEFYPSGYKGRMKRRGTFTGQSLSAGETPVMCTFFAVLPSFTIEENPFRGFSSSRSVVHRDPRNATPPAAFSPGPSVAGCCPPPLARTAQ